MNATRKPMTMRLQPEKGMTPQRLSDTLYQDGTVIATAVITDGPQTMIARRVLTYVDLDSFARKLPAASAVILYRHLLALKVDKISAAATF